MSSQNIELVINLESKIDKLAERYRTERSENAMLRSEIGRLSKQLEEAAMAFSEMEKRFENLKMAKTFEVSSKDVQATKVRINQIIKEVDKCIALLNS